MLEARRRWIENPPANHAMTPAITAVRKAAIAYTLHEYDHDPKARSFGLEAAQKLGFDPQRVFKTLIVELDTGPLGQKKRLTTIIYSSALAFDTVYVSGGRRGLDLELAPEDLLRLLNATSAELCWAHDTGDALRNLWIALRLRWHPRRTPSHHHR